ncbi:hypothetical protein GE061_016041 [Apolygus lucorum]|uniref:Uncharacterized protein n=1 Tax=Apolygus lucorum TaxID=248454 RepID=A0A8S9XG97_APOLU|nr:hypothetical protein GE061_016041 [Apolygus lucorum]
MNLAVADGLFVWKDLQEIGKGGLVWGSECGGSGGGSVATNSRCGGGSGPQQGQGFVHWMSVMAEHMNTVAAHDSVPSHYMWNGTEQCGPHGKEDYGWPRQSMVKQGYEAKMNEQNNQGMHKGTSNDCDSVAILLNGKLT